ncbi:MAG: hypothetical protein ACK5PB_19625 [Pirellula sp.]|jgi:hypothetical protein
MDVQTIMALAIVSGAAVVLVCRIFAAAKRTLSTDVHVSSGCGSCGGCPSRSISAKSGVESEMVLVTLQKRPKQ